MTNPREDPECTECEPGELEYDRQSTDARGDPVSVFKCPVCGHEVTTR